MVLLKNDGGALPLNPTKSVAVIGPLGDDQHDMLGPWWGTGRDKDAVSLYTGIKAQDPNTTFVKACDLPNNEPPQYNPAMTARPAPGSTRRCHRGEVADQIVLALGETRGDERRGRHRAAISTCRASSRS